MARITAQNARILGRGYDLSGRSNSITLTFSAEAPEVTTFGADTRERLPGGIRDLELSVDGFFDSAASQVDAIFSELLTGSGYWAVFPEGFGASKIGRELAGILTEYESEAAVEDATTTAITVTGCSLTAHVLSLGRVAAASAASGSAATPSVDFAGSATSTLGFVHYLEISTSGFAASLQHSGDDSTFTTLIDFGEMLSPCQGTALAASATSASRYRRLRYYLGAGASVNVVATSGS